MLTSCAFRNMPKVTMQVPVHFTGEDASPGIKRGGVLNIVRHDLELVCDAAMIPDEIEVSLAGFDVGDSIHISAVTLPAGAEERYHRPRFHDRDNRCTVRPQIERRRYID